MVSVKAAAGCQLVSVLAVENVSEGSLEVPSRFPQGSPHSGLQSLRWLVNSQNNLNNTLKVATLDLLPGPDGE